MLALTTATQHTGACSKEKEKNVDKEDRKDILVYVENAKEFTKTNALN